MKDGKYEYSEPFASWFRGVLIERENINARKAQGEQVEASKTFEQPPEPPTAKQLGFLKKLGATEKPQTKREASDMIGELLKKKP